MHTFTQHPVKLFSVLVLAGGLFLGGMTGQVQAKDTKVYPGELCRPARGNLNTTSFLYENGTIKNFDYKHDLTIVCPIIRDNTTMKSLRAWGFSGKNANKNGRPLSCTMFSKFWPTGRVLDRNSMIMKYDLNHRIVSTDRGPKKAGKTYLSLVCSIPPTAEGVRSFLTSYFVVEP